MSIVTVIVNKGGKGSGHFGHAGRKGLVGGSTAGTTYIGAKPLSEYIKELNKYPIVYEDDYTAEKYGRKNNPAHWRDVPYKDANGDVLTDYSVLRGLDSEIRKFEKYPEDMGMTFDEYVTRSEDAFRSQLAESDVYMRITPENLEEALIEEQFENTFTSKKTGAAFEENKVSYKTYLSHRVEGEEVALGVPKNTPGDERPIYGYWSQEGGATEHFDSWLGQYGSVTVEFDKASIADKLTFTDSDSLDMHGRVRSSDWRDPSILSSFGFGFPRPSKLLVIIYNILSGPRIISRKRPKRFEKCCLSVILLSSISAS